MDLMVKGALKVTMGEMDEEEAADKFGVHGLFSGSTNQGFILKVASLRIYSPIRWLSSDTTATAPLWAIFTLHLAPSQIPHFVKSVFAASYAPKKT